MNNTSPSKSRTTPQQRSTSTSAFPDMLPPWDDIPVGPARVLAYAVAAEVWERTHGPRYAGEIAEAELVAIQQSGPDSWSHYLPVIRLNEDQLQDVQEQAVAVGMALGQTLTASLTSYEVWTLAAMAVLDLHPLSARERAAYDVRIRAAFDARDAATSPRSPR